MKKVAYAFVFAVLLCIGSAFFLTKLGNEPQRTEIIVQDPTGLLTTSNALVPNPVMYLTGSLNLRHQVFNNVLAQQYLYKPQFAVLSQRPP